MKRTTTWSAALVSVAVLTATPGARATEGGGNQYPVGVETVLGGLMPPDGFHLFNYYAHYTSRHLKDNAGDDVFSSFKLRADVVAARLSYVWPGIHPFGASLETRFVVAVPTLELDARGTSPFGPFRIGGSTTRPNDPTFAPALFGWHSETVHQIAGLESLIGVGSYDQHRTVNAGRNYTEGAAFYAITWLPDDRAQFDFKARYAINSRNHATDYRSGDELTVESSAGYRVHPDVLLGINGYLYHQTTDDRQFGESVNGNGNRGRADAIGPFLGYSFTKKFTVLCKVQKEFAVRNRPEGTTFWLQTKVPFE